MGGGEIFTTRDESKLSNLLRQPNASFESAIAAMPFPEHVIRTHFKKSIKAINKLLKGQGIEIVDSHNEQICVMALSVWFECRGMGTNPERAVESIAEALKLRRNLTLRLAPRNPDSPFVQSLKIRSCNPFLELDVRPSKTLQDIVDHLHKKWDLNPSSTVQFFSIHCVPIEPQNFLLPLSSACEDDSNRILSISYEIMTASNNNSNSNSSSNTNSNSNSNDSHSEPLSKKCKGLLDQFTVIENDKQIPSQISLSQTETPFPLYLSSVHSTSVAPSPPPLAPSSPAQHVPESPPPSPPLPSTPIRNTQTPHKLIEPFSTPFSMPPPTPCVPVFSPPPTPTLRFPLLELPFEMGTDSNDSFERGGAPSQLVDANNMSALASLGSFPSSEDVMSHFGESVIPSENTMPAP